MVHPTTLEILNEYGEGEYLQGKTALVTGGNAGIGLNLCKALAKAGARVILCSRSVARGEEAVVSGITQNGTTGYALESASNIIVKELDLNSLKSVKALADDILATEDRIDFLVLNAGIMALPTMEKTKDGLEKQIGVNHVGHFYLTRLLINKIIKQNTPGRIITLSSSANKYCSEKMAVFSDFKYKKLKYAAWPAYQLSKACNLLFTKELADQLINTKVTAVSVHPGIVMTDLWKQSFFNNYIVRYIYPLISTEESLNPDQGAATSLWACVCPKIATVGMRGAYLSACKESHDVSVTCKDEKGIYRKKCWEETEKCLGEVLQELGLPSLEPMQVK